MLEFGFKNMVTVVYIPAAPRRHISYMDKLSFSLLANQDPDYLLRGSGLTFVQSLCTLIGILEYLYEKSISWPLFLLDAHQISSNNCQLSST